MSFSRLRRSSRYPMVIDIYTMVGEDCFCGKEVGLDHSKIGILKNYGYIVKQPAKIKIITDKKTSYEVSTYCLSQAVITIIEEDLTQGKIQLSDKTRIPINAKYPEDKQKKENEQ